MIVFIVTCMYAVLTQSGAQESKLVNINQGPVIGYKAQEADVFAFYNIPYATAPKGPHKFKSPLLPPSWDEPFEAVDKDVMFIYGMLRSVTLQVEAGNNKMYLHQFSYAHDKLPIIPYTNMRGANHCAQMDVVVDEDESVLSDEYRNLKATMREVWLNFIITGNPTPDGFSEIPTWTPANAQRSPCMSIGKTIELVDSVASDRFKFWNDIYDRYYRNTIQPTEVAVPAK
ncbi:unnamed protein product [Diatraea saccharalis]|uniref:Carboxylesterase type B domain-containing protein n=1 Tax=Diatraea saccharalis TaxID=40085 RepID=A0A9N9QLH0_9NEOP|nr:unnamed protein product [Diatraea saccharalis]